MTAAHHGAISSLMSAFRAGDRNAGARLVDLFYPELKRLASGQMKKERQDHSWQPTLLVHELYLQVAKIKALPASDSPYRDDKAAFMALAGLLMRRLLIHHARPLAHKIERVPLWEELEAQPDKNIAEVESILRKLEAIKPIYRTVVELKVFEGQTAEEIADQLKCAPVTIKRHWQFVRHWMQVELSED